MTCARGCCPTQRDHYRSVGFGASTTPFRRADTVSKDAMEGRWHADMPAYKRLRDEGLQPQQIDGAATLERHAEHRKQIEMGTLAASAKQIDLADRISRDVGMTV